MTFVSPHPAEWHQKRLSGIGGSDAAAIAGFDFYRSPLAVYYEKIGEIANDGSSEATHWGHVLEGPVAEEYARRHNVTVANAPPFIPHREHDFLFANLDRLIVEEPDAFLEVKTTGHYSSHNWDEGVPKRVEIQALHCMEVAEKTRAHVCVLMGGQTYADFTIERDDRAIKALLHLEAEFWQRVCERRPPPADGSDSATDTLKAAWPNTIEAKAVVLPPDAATWLARRNEAAAAEKAAKAAKGEYDNLIRQAMEDAEEGWLEGRTVCTLRTVKGSHVSYDRKPYRKLDIKEAN